MTKPSFADEIIYQGFDAPSRIEADVFDLEVTMGEIPKELNGTLLRVGPDPQFPRNPGHNVFFADDGVAYTFKFKGGHVDFRSRYVETDRLKAERKARRALFGNMMNPYTDDPSVEGMIRGVANTNLIYHHGKLLALCEDSPPVEMNPDTLETIGNYRFKNDKMTSVSYTAHPRIDPQNGELVGFSYFAKGLGSHDMCYYVVDKEGELVHETWFKSLRPGMVHDFGMSENFVMFPIAAHTIEDERLREGKPALRWNPDVEQMFAVLPRRGEEKDLRWFKYPDQGFHGHVVNAWDDGEKMYVDMTLADDNVFIFFPADNAEAPNVFEIKNRIARWTFDLSSDSDEPQLDLVCDVMGEMPYIDDRYTGKEHTHVFMGVIDPTQPYDFEKCGPPINNPLNGLAHLNAKTGELTTWFPGPTTMVCAPVFAPRSADAPEGDGYVIALVNHITEMRNDLVILDSKHIDKGPIAVASVPVRIRSGVHSNWVPASKME